MNSASSESSLSSAFVDSTASRSKSPNRAQQQDDLAAITRARREFRGRVQKFAEENLGLAYEYADRWKCPHIPQEDLKQEAVLWMLEAVQRWEPDKGRSFSTYAMWWMRYGLTEFVKHKFPVVHLPGNVRADQRVVKKSMRQLEVALGRPATEEELKAATPELSGPRLEIALAYLGGLHFCAPEDAGPAARALYGRELPNAKECSRGL